MELVTPSGLSPSGSVEIRYPKSISNLCVLLSVGFIVLIFAICEVILPKSKQTDREALPVAYGMWVAAAVFGYVLRKIIVIRVDAQGVATTPGGFAVRPVLVRWSEIHSCELLVTRNRRGKVNEFYPVFTNSAGRAVVHCLINWGNVPMAEKRKLFLALKSRFGKPDPDPWESLAGQDNAEETSARRGSAHALKGR
jgi:hypothetical protein